MESRLVVTGGFPYNDNFNMKKEGFRYKDAFLAEIELPEGRLARQEKYVSPPDRIGKSFSMQFKFGHFFDDKLILPTSTEIIIFDRKSWAIIQTISHPSFHDLHCVKVYQNRLYVVNTGLEMVQIFDFKGNCAEEINVTDHSTWKRFDPNTDYRFIPSTKPHLSHANYIFFLDNEPWITRFEQRDAVALYDFSKRIDLGVKESQGKPHDGLVKGDNLYFTLTDGFVVIVNRKSFKIEKVINFNLSNDSDLQPGWCRGLDVVDGKVYVGFSQLRKSNFVEYGSWIKHRKRKLPARICVFDLKDGSLINEIPITSNTGAAIFSILLI